MDDIYKDPHLKKNNFFLHYGDLTDSLTVLKNIKAILPDEIYNLAAQSHVGVSFQLPEYTAQVDALGALRILDLIKTLNLKKKYDIIKQVALKCSDRPSLHKMKKLFFIPAALMLLQKFMLIGLQLIIERHMEFLHVMAFFLIMRAQ